MKKAVLLFITLGTMYCSLAQQIPARKSKPAHTKEEYLQKSKKLWTAAIVMVSVGGVMAITGLAMGLNESNGNGGSGDVSGVLFVGGCGLMLGSLGCSIPGTIFKKKAMSLSFKNEPASSLQRGMVFNKTVPSLSLKISL
ncbi:MAG: hypothetical protein ABI760_13330 [Ferruginibacter sp.]